MEIVHVLFGAFFSIILIDKGYQSQLGLNIEGKESK